MENMEVDPPAASGDVATRGDGRIGTKRFEVKKV
jgi:hypothetical protein